MAQTSESTSATTAQVGDTIRGKWRLDALIGTGGMGSVYAATHRNGMRGAVKMLHRSHLASSDLKERFLREGYIANKIAHPSVVLVLDDDTAEDGSPFLVMELLEGASLAARADDSAGRLPPQQVMLAADQLLDVLAVAHDAGVVHRDIKPENIFLTTDGVVKVLDFGIAHLTDNAATSSELTHTGIAMGTPAFMSPEQARGRWDLVDATSDLFSVGATMFTLASGELVHPEGTTAEITAATFLKQARSLADAANDLPPPLVAIVDRALRLAKAERWSDAKEMQAALRDAYREIFGSPMPEAPTASRMSLRTPFAFLPQPAPRLVSGDDVKRAASKPPAHAAETAASLASEPPRPRAIGRRRATFVAVAVFAGIAVVVTIATGRRAHDAPAAATSSIRAASASGAAPATPPLKAPPPVQADADAIAAASSSSPAPLTRPSKLRGRPLHAAPASGAPASTNIYDRRN